MQIKKLAPDTVFVTPASIRQTKWADALQAVEVKPFKGHLWEQLTLALFMQRHPQAVLFSPANSGPLFVERQVLTLHDLAFRLFPADQSPVFRAWYNFLIPRLVRQVRSICTVSETIRQDISKIYGVDPARVSVTYNGLALPWQRLSSGKELIEKEKMILCVGTLSPRKQTDRLVEAFIKSERLKDYHLVLIGHAHPSFVRLDLPAHNRVQHIADADDDCLLSYYQRAEVAVCLSAYEGFGLPVLEGLAFGCRTLCSDIPVFRELYEGAVLFCDTDQQQDIIDKLEFAALHKPVGCVPLETLLSKYSYEQSGRQVLALLQNT